MTARCDIFCRVVDNYGDIGVCWRLARQLANEHGLKVRLWVDELSSLARLCHEVDDQLAIQHRRGVEVRAWSQNFPRVQLPDIVIETFACMLPESYMTAMAAQAQQPVWVNLEYLSAENWIESHHKLPSPHPRLPLVKDYFFPGFTRQTGGLLLERDLLTRRDLFQNDALQQQAFWQSMDLEIPAAGTLKISLFSYENTALPGLLDAWTTGTQPVLCLVPEGRILPQAGQYFGDEAPQTGKDYRRGNLRLRVLPFVEQERYDLLLWACDINFVRGEDSCVRAIWAGRPFVWQIYPQPDSVHLKKLEAFLILYTGQLNGSASTAVRDLWRAWNSSELNTQLSLDRPLSGEVAHPPIRGSREEFNAAGHAWPAFAAKLDELNRHSQHFLRQLAENNLAGNLLDFCREIGRMRALKIEG